MSIIEQTPRRRIAVLDGAGRHELALAPHVLLADALAAAGIRLESGRHVLVGRSGDEVPPTLPAGDLDDGAVLALVDLAEHPQPRPQRERGSSPVRASFWWLVAGAVAVIAAVAVVTIPGLRASTSILAVFTGLCAAAVLAGLLAVVSRSGIHRAELGTLTLILLALAAVWGFALAVDLPVSAPAAVSLGAVPLALRALPQTLMDVSPGTFIEYRRFQTSRWAVRQQLPADVGPIEAAAARELVDRATARLRAGTAALSATAAVSAPLALGAFDSADPLVFGGQIALAACAVLALLLGARRSSIPSLRWMARAAALVVLAVALAGVLHAAGSLWLTVAGGVALAAGVMLAFAVIPAARGSRSLAWSRLGDVLEWLSVVLALPAGLVAAGIIGVLRGAMGG